MNGCDDCRERMLDSLYDLLDEAEQAALAGHLAGCGDCQAALARAKEQQRLLAAAARLEFPAVRFVPPADAPAPAPAAPVLCPLPAPARAPRPWRRWAVAAGLLLGVGGLTAAGLHHGGQYAQARAEVARQEQTIDGALAAQ